MNYADILDALRELVARERIEFLSLAPDAKGLSSYAPIQKYVLDLKNSAKPETSAPPSAASNVISPAPNSLWGNWPKSAWRTPPAAAAAF